MPNSRRTMAPPHPRSNKNRLILLLSILDHLQAATHPEEAEVAMAEFTFELLQLRIIKDTLRQNTQRQMSATATATASTTTTDVLMFRKGNETLLSNLEAHGGISVLLGGMTRFMGRASSEFFNSATIALVHLSFQSQTRSMAMYQQGGMELVIRMMQVYRTADYVQIIGIAGLMVLGQNLGLTVVEEDLESIILTQIVRALESHRYSSTVYQVACSAMGTLLGPMSIRAKVIENTNNTTTNHEDEDEYDIYHRALHGITYGLVLHVDDPAAQGVGNALLSNMVGPDMADEMIAQVEMSHGTTLCCAAAA